MTAGIPAAAFSYFRDVAAHNERSWWQAHRARWDDGVRTPLIGLADALSPEFGELSVSRPNRDIRLTADTSPYRDYAAVSRVQRRGAGLYLQIDATGMLVAAGLWRPDRTQLDRFRRAVDDDDTARALDDVVVGLRRHRLPLGDGVSLTGTPRGYPADHPRIDLLRRTRLTVERRWNPAAWMETPECVRRIRTAWRAGAAWNEWLDAHVGGGSIEQSAGRSLPARPRDAR